MNTLRALVWINYHCSPDLGRCSAVNFCIDLCNELHRLTDGGFLATFIGPSVGSRLLLPARLRLNANLDVLPLGPSDFAKSRPFPSDQLIDAIHPDKSDIPYDILITRDTITALRFAYALEYRDGMWAMDVEVPISTFAQDSFQDECVYKDHYRGANVCTASSLLLSSQVVVHSQDEQKKMFDFARRYMSGTEIARLQSNSVVLPCACDLDGVNERLTDYRSRRLRRLEKDDRVVFFHGGTYQSKRHLGDVCRGLDEAAVHLAKKMKFLNSSQVNGSLSCKNVEVELRNSQTREQYYDNLADGDICIISTDWETTGIAYMEAIASGMLPIVLDTPWIMERMPPNYPFVMKNIVRDLPLLATYMLKNKAEAMKWWPKVRESIEKWTFRSSGPSYLSAYQGLVEKKMAKNREWLEKAIGSRYYVRACAEMPDTFDGFERLEAKAVEIAKAEGVTVRNFSSMILRWIVMSAGFEDVGGMKVPVFKRVK